MLDVFKNSFKLRNAYKANSFIYALKSLPIIKRLLPASLYGNEGLKIFANVVGVFYEIGTVFMGKLLYLFLMVFLAAQAMPAGLPGSFYHIFFFSTVVGGLLNTDMFNPTKDKYYAMFLMRMDARQYTLVNYGYFLLKTLVGFLPFTLLFGLLSKAPFYLCLLMPLLVCGVKLCVTAVNLLLSRGGTKVRSENLPTPVVWGGIAVGLAAAYGLPAMGYAMNGLVFGVLCGLAIIGGVFSLGYVLRFRAYRDMYRVLLKPDSFVKNATVSAQTVYQKKIDADVTKTSHKSGYAFFNELFMKRHSRLLTKSAKRITAIALGVLAVAAAVCLAVPELKAQANGAMLTVLPYFLFVMYFINRGKVITQAMFMNCDHSMLTYRFYRQPKVVLALFAQRLKYIVAINLMPAGVIAVGLPLLLWLTGGTDDPLNYLLLFVSILAMSVFFSVHNMVLYYLLQPYNVNVEVKSAAFGVVNSLTYIVCYVAIGKEVPTLVFGSLISAFCVVYVIAALLLAYRLAPKTFKLRQ